MAVTICQHSCSTLMFLDIRTKFNRVRYSLGPIHPELNVAYFWHYDIYFYLDINVVKEDRFKYLAVTFQPISSDSKVRLYIDKIASLRLNIVIDVAEFFRNQNLKHFNALSIGGFEWKCGWISTQLSTEPNRNQIQ